MMIKGTTIIELTDVNTGEVEVVKEENMFTNALKILFGENPHNVMTASNLNTWSTFYKGSLGGVMLFNQQIEENEDTLIPPAGITCTAHAGNDTYGGALLSRGSLNLTESELLPDGFKQVWDFATSQGNGTIQSVCLSSYQGGAQGIMRNNLINTENVGFFEQIPTIPTGAGVVSFGRRGYVYALSGNLANASLTKYEFPADEIRLTASFSSKKEIGTVNFSLPSNTINSYYGETALYYTLPIATSTPTIYKVDLETMTFSSKTYDLPVLVAFNAGAQSLNHTTNSFAIEDDILYCLSKRSASETDVEDIYIYVINLRTGTLIRQTQYPYSTFSRRLAPQKVLGQILTTTCWIAPNGAVSFHGGETSVSTAIGRLSDMLYTWGPTGSTAFTSMIFTHYLATINNLDSPVVKTPDRTMKITYVVREE